ncbi:MAG: hypothetical protein KDD42_07155 [Bdellovibrionales bacterium]|nr:hypothetical protein [Bdellovibrionales bacterium]
MAADTVYHCTDGSFTNSPSSAQDCRPVSAPVKCGEGRNRFIGPSKGSASLSDLSCSREEAPASPNVNSALDELLEEANEKRAERLEKQALNEKNAESASPATHQSENSTQGTTLDPKDHWLIDLTRQAIDQLQQLFDAMPG